MKTLSIGLFTLWLAAGLNIRAQEQESASSPPLSSGELEELLGPIALYPDPLISLILPAATMPSDIVLADRFIASGGSADAVDDKPWDPSVKGLARYPDTLKWLDDNLDWTTQVGDAFSNQEENVMQAIQSLRAKAKSVGNLADTPEERIVQDDDNIRVIPARPDSIYVPSYDPEVVYVQPPQAEPLVYFSAPYAVGSWLSYDFDWHHHHLYRGDWHRGWDYRRDRERDHGTRIFINNNISNSRVWHVDARRRQNEIRNHHEQHFLADRGNVHIAHPQRRGGSVRSGEVIRRAEIPGASRSHAPLVKQSPKDVHHFAEGNRGRDHIAVPHSNPPHLKSQSPNVHLSGPKARISRPHAVTPKSSHVSRPQAKVPNAKPHSQIKMPSPKAKVQSRPHSPSHSQGHLQPHPQEHHSAPRAKASDGVHHAKDPKKGDKKHK